MWPFSRKWIREEEQTKFDDIDLRDFRSFSCRYLTGYALMYINIIISLAAFGSDIYTAVVLLAFDRWSSTIKPYIPFRIARWLYAGCIIFSVLLLVYELIRSIHTMKTKNVSLNYTDPLAHSMYSIRHYRYFCLFLAITKSRNKTEYLALFVYFSFKGWIRLILADSPRQVLNALSLFSVLQVSTDFVGAVKKLASSSVAEATVVCLMTFSLVIWAIRVSQFLIACICALPLLAHVEKTCSGLEEFCCTRVNNRIRELVEKNHRKGMIELIEANKRMSKKPTVPLINADLFADDIEKGTGVLQQPYMHELSSQYSLSSTSSKANLLGSSSESSPEYMRGPEDEIPHYRGMRQPQSDEIGPIKMPVAPKPNDPVASQEWVNSLHHVKMPSAHITTTADKNRPWVPGPAPNSTGASTFVFGTAPIPKQPGVIRKPVLASQLTQVPLDSQKAPVLLPQAAETIAPEADQRRYSSNPFSPRNISSNNGREEDLICDVDTLMNAAYIKSSRGSLVRANTQRQPALPDLDTEEILDRLPHREPTVPDFDIEDESQQRLSQRQPTIPVIVIDDDDDATV